MDDHDVIIIGAGLSGLATAHLLREAGHEPLVLEALDRPGGRITSLRGEDGAWLADLGPSWIWPPYQPIAAHWLVRLGVATFPQHTDGDAVLDFDPAPRRQTVPGQHGIARIEDGPQALVDALVANLPAQGLRLDTPVAAVEKQSGQLILNGEHRAHSIIVATPPRIAKQTIAWNGLLDEAVLSEMATTPTWMASQAKLVATYATPFWREEGLSGHVMSRIGPMAEIHDHCGPDGTPAALFGFLAVPHDLRQRHPEEVREACIDQLIRCFGKQAGAFETLHIQDWAMVDSIAAKRDLAEPPEHPSVRSHILREPHGEERIVFAGAEVAETSPGLIEGALVAAEKAVLSITNAHG